MSTWHDQLSGYIERARGRWHAKTSASNQDFWGKQGALEELKRLDLVINATLAQEEDTIRKLVAHYREWKRTPQGYSQWAADTRFLTAIDKLLAGDGYG